LSDTDDLLAIADQLANLKGKFIESDKGWFLQIEDQSSFQAIVAETRAILGGSLGHVNDFTLGIITTTTRNTVDMFGGPTYSCVSDVEGLVRAAVRQITRKEQAQPTSVLGAPKVSPYVGFERILELRSLPKDQWDFAKLVQLCIELNDVSASEKTNYATAMLVRAIVDHVPPLFGMKNFSQVADNYGGTSSFKGSMQHLNRSMRNIADGILHEQIRSKESLPSPQQVDFRQDLDRLLGEIVRISKQ
jgi:hypothetical protein